MVLQPRQPMPVATEEGFLMAWALNLHHHLLKHAPIWETVTEGFSKTAYLCMETFSLAPGLNQVWQTCCLAKSRLKWMHVTLWWFSLLFTELFTLESCSFNKLDATHGLLVLYCLMEALCVYGQEAACVFVPASTWTVITSGMLSCSRGRRGRSGWKLGSVELISIRVELWGLTPSSIRLLCSSTALPKNTLTR